MPDTEVAVSPLRVAETPTFRVDQMPYGGMKGSGNTATARITPCVP
jgi:hypothetical protein